MALPVFIIVSCIACYSLVIFLFSSGLRKESLSQAKEKGSSLKVSVIIAFHNEVENLPFLVKDLLAQNYPSVLFEVVFVDDHSSDGSLSLLDSLVSGVPNFSQLPSLPENSGKKAALNYGIQHAAYDRLIQVDADCRLGPQFIASHMNFLEKHPSDLVAGFLKSTRNRGGFLEAYESLDLMALLGTGAGSFALGRPMMCSGANLSYSRDLYMETRVFDPVEVTQSGDDMFLMIGARKLKRTISFNTSYEACVKTTPVSSFRALLLQRMRWGAKTTRYGMADIQMLAILVALSNFTILLMPIWILLFTDVWPCLLGAWIVKTLVDFSLIYKVAGLCRQRRSLLWFLPVSLAYYPVFFLSMVGSVLGISRWKRAV